jgi:hypothetical protein
MYFQSFPYTLYTLDNRQSIQLIANFLLRTKIDDTVKNNIGVFDEYDVMDGETPEIVADKFYKNPSLHWLVLQYNDIIDPRFDWPMSTNNLNRFIEGKYGDVNGIHHYEDNDGNTINGVLQITSYNEFASFNVNDAIVNVTNTGTGVITDKTDDSTITVTVTSGGFKLDDQIKIYNTTTSANIVAAAVQTGTAVTNFVYEDLINESKRRIKVLQSKYVDSVVKDFKSKIQG